MINYTQRLKKLAGTLTLSAVLVVSFCINAVNVKADTTISPNILAPITVNRTISTQNTLPGTNFTVNYQINPANIANTNIVDTTPIDIVLVIDQSNSMGDPISINGSYSKFAATKAAADSFAQAFSGNSRVNIGVVSYTGYATMQCDLTNISNIATISDKINNIPLNDGYNYGGTNTGDGMRVAYYMLQKSTHSNSKKYIVLMTDGLVNAYSCYKNGSGYFGENITPYFCQNNTDHDIITTSLNYATTIGSNIKDANINSYMVGFFTDGTGDGADTKLQQIATSAGGTYKQALTAQDISNIYNSVAGQINWDLRVTNINFSETIPNGITVDTSSLPQGFTLTGQTITGTIDNINYTLQSDNKTYVASPKTFSIQYKATKPGDFTLASSSSILNYNDINNTSQTKNFNQLNINVGNNVPPTITLGSYDGSTPTSKPITVTATAKDSQGTDITSFLNERSHTFTQNGSFTFTVTDSWGNTTSQPVVINNINTSTAGTGVTINVTDSSNQNIIPYTNNAGTSSNNILTTPSRLSTNPTAKISYNLNNVTTAKYGFVEATDLTTVPNLPQDSTMSDINLPPPNSYEAYAGDIVKNGYINAKHYVYQGKAGQMLSRDISFGTPVSNGVLVQEAIAKIDIYETSGDGSNAFILDMDNGNRCYSPNKNAAMKAMKVWGYFSPKTTGYYLMGAYSDDGAYGYIVVNGAPQVFVSDWRIAGPQFRSTPAGTKNDTAINTGKSYTGINLIAGNYYPIYMEWYEGCPTQGAFLPQYIYSSSSQITIPSDINSSPSKYAIPSKELYSSKTTLPGTVASAYFGDVSGIKFPTEDGNYYIATKFVSNEGTTSGMYGPFIVDNTKPVISNLNVISNNSVSNKIVVPGNTITISFSSSENLKGNPQILINGFTADVKYIQSANNNYVATINIGSDGKINSNGDKLTQSGPLVVTINHYSDLSGNEGNEAMDNSVIFNSNIKGITLSLSKNPIEATSGNVTVKVGATAYNYNNKIQVLKYASGNQSIDYFRVSGTNLQIGSYTNNNGLDGMPQSSTEASFSVSTNGTYTVYAVDSIGKIAVKTITVDNIITIPPVITSPSNNTLTNNNRPTIAGTGETGATVTVYDNGKSIGTTTVNSDGTWNFSSASILNDGNHVITATQKGVSGSESQSSNSVNLTIDTTAPNAPVITSPVTETITNNNKPVISGTAEVNSIVTVYDGSTSIGTATADEKGAWTFTPNEALTEGTHSITAKSTDSAGNVSAVSNAVRITIDTINPTGIINYSLISPTNQNVVATLTTSEDVTIINNPTVNYTFETNSDFTFTFKDKAGNEGSAVAKVTNIDKEAPDATGTIKFVLVSGGANVTFTPKESTNYIELTYDGELHIISRQLCEEPVTFKITKSQTVKAIYKDEAGNISKEADLFVTCRQIH